MTSLPPSLLMAAGFVTLAAPMVISGFVVPDRDGPG